MLNVEAHATESWFRDDHHRPKRSPSLDSTRNYLVSHIGSMVKIENTGWKRLFAAPSYRLVMDLQDAVGNALPPLTITGSRETVEKTVNAVLHVASNEATARAIRLNRLNELVVGAQPSMLDVEASLLRQDLKKRNIFLPD